MPAALELVVARDPALLLERAAVGIHAPAPFTAPTSASGSSSYLLAVRQGGLRDDLIARARARGVAGELESTLCVFDELPRWLGATAHVALDEGGRTMVLGGVLRRFAGDVFGRLHRAESLRGGLDQLFGELVSEAVTPDRFLAALEQRHERDELERQRDAELALAYREYIETLERMGRRDGRDVWIDCARAIIADPDRLAMRLRGRRELRLLGLHDLRGGWRTLLAALHRSPALDRIAIYTTAQLDLGSDLPYETIALEAIAAPADARTIQVVTAPAEARTIQVIAAPDVERELELVAARVRGLADRGVPLDRIAVVARQARPHLDLALRALERAGVTATARRRFVLADIPVVRAIRGLLGAAAAGWSRHDLVGLAEQPYLPSDLDAGMLNFIGRRRRVRGLSQWQRLLHELAVSAEQDERRRTEHAGSAVDRHAAFEADHRHPLPPAARCRAAAEGFDRFVERAAVLDQTKTLADWLAWLDALLHDDPWEIRARIDAVPAEYADIARLDHMGWDRLSTIVTRWREALEVWGRAADPVGIDEFVRQLTDLLVGDVVLWTDARDGVQVLEGMAAAYRTSDHLFIVGLSAGEFPLPPARTSILDEWDRRSLRAAGLPLESRDAWDARERELFRVLVAGGASLTISYARMDAAGRETARSAFVEALADVASLSGAAEHEEIPASTVLIDGIRLYTDAAAYENALHAATIERARATGERSPYNGRIEHPELLARLAREFGDDRLWSPTQLESYAKCPWSYLSARLFRVSRLEEPDDEMGAATRGSLLHDALRRFYTRAAERTGGPVFLRADDANWAMPLLVAALDEALEAARATQWLGSPPLLPAKREELRRLLVGFLEWEIQEHEDMDNPRKRNAPRMVRTGVAEHELAFHDVTLERGGVRFRFRGSVDRIEVGVDGRCASGHFVAAVDYKTTVWGAPGGGEPDAWHDGVVLQVPLYAYALTQARPGSEPVRVEYRALKQRKAIHSLELYQFDKKSGQVVRNEDAMRRMERALDDVALHVQQARRGEFPAAPAPSCGCPNYCHALEICRVPGGPRLKSW